MACVVVKLLSVFMLKCPWALGQLGDHPRTLKVVQIIAQGVECEQLFACQPTFNCSLPCWTIFKGTESCEDV